MSIDKSFWIWNWSWGLKSIKSPLAERYLPSQAESWHKIEKINSNINLFQTFCPIAEDIFLLYMRQYSVPILALKVIFLNIFVNLYISQFWYISVPVISITLKLKLILLLIICYVHSTFWYHWSSYLFTYFFVPWSSETTKMLGIFDNSSKIMRFHESHFHLIN